LILVDNCTYHMYCISYLYIYNVLFTVLCYVHSDRLVSGPYAPQFGDPFEPRPTVSSGQRNMFQVRERNAEWAVQSATNHQAS